MTSSGDELVGPGRSKASELGLVFAAGITQMLVVIDYTATAVALPSMAREFGVTADSLQWVITGYILSFSIMLAVAGPLGDRFGRKRLLLLGVLLFGACSAWVGAAGSVTELIVSRIALGIGGGLLFPLSTAVVGAGAKREDLPRLMSILTGVASVGMAIGPVFGGVFTELVNWRWIFYLNIPISLIAILLMSWLAAESRNPDATGRIDFGGIVLLTLAIGGLSLGVAWIPDHPPEIWSGLVVGSIVVFAIFAWYELRLATPLIDLRLLGNRFFAGYALGGSLSNACWCVLIFNTTLFLQEVRHEDAMIAGLQFLYLSVPVAAAGFLGPMVQRRIGTRNLVLLATAVQTIACLIFWMSHLPPWLGVGLFIAGFGCSWGWSMSQAGGIATLPERHVGLASGSILTALIISGNIAVVVIATVIAALGGPDLKNYAPGVDVNYLIGAGLAAAAFVATAVIVPRRPAGTEPEDQSLKRNQTTESSNHS